MPAESRRSSLGSRGAGRLSPEGVEQARAMATGTGVALAIERAHPYPEGRWLFIPVATVDDLRDVQALLALRAQEKRTPLRSVA